MAIRRVKGERTYKPDATDKGRIERSIDICSDAIDFPDLDRADHDAVMKQAIAAMKPLVELEALLWPNKTPAEEPEPAQ